jgi:hypothetical protein
MAFQSNSQLLTIDGFGSLLGLPSTLTITSNNKLLNINGLLSLQQINSSVSIQSNPVLLNIDGLYNVRIIRGGLTVLSNGGLVSVAGLCGTKNITGSMNVQGASLCCSAGLDITAPIGVAGSTKSTFSGTSGNTCAGNLLTPCTVANNYTCECRALPDLCQPTYLGCLSVRPSYVCDIIQCQPLSYSPLFSWVDTNNHTYPSTATYTCSTGYRTNDSLVRTCQKNTYWTYNDPNCVDINECVENGCDSRAFCENTIGSHYCGPFSIPNTLTVIDGAYSVNTTGPQANVTVNSILGGSWVEWTFNRGNITNITHITYKQISTPYVSRQCLQFSIHEMDPIPSDIYARMRCQLEAGHGQYLTFTIHFCTATQCNSSHGTDTVSYPPPSATDGTLRLIPTVDSPLDGSGANNVVAPNLDQQMVAFDGHNFVNDSSVLIIWFGPFYKLRLYQCSVIPEMSTDYRVVCLTEADAYGSGMRFTLLQDGYELLTTDTFSFPTSAPLVTIVSGCDPDPSNVNGTFNCPTTGGTTLTIWGENFLEPVTAFVNGATCVIGTHPVASNYFTCVMPPGAGFEQSVTIASLDLFSTPAKLVSYAVPTIDALQGCDVPSTVTTSTSVAECQRVGGDSLTILGANFGAAGASVFIGSDKCLSVIHDAVTPHARLTCILPAGNRLDRPLVLFQRNGELSESEASVSFLQCPSGQHEDPVAPSIACIPCETGSYSGSSGALTCTACAAGKYMNDTGALACYQCPAGQYQLNYGQTTCDACSIGTYNSGFLANCAECDSGKYTASNGSSSCDSCPYGTYQTETGRSFCNPCPAGQFSGLGSTTCSSCSASTYAAGDQCIACPDNSKSDSSRAFCICNAGFYLLYVTSGNDTRPVCITCPTGAY